MSQISQTKLNPETVDELNLYSCKSSDKEMKVCTLSSHKFVQPNVSFTASSQSSAPAGRSLGWNAQEDGCVSCDKRKEIH